MIGKERVYKKGRGKNVKCEGNRKIGEDGKKEIIYGKGRRKQEKIVRRKGEIKSKNVKRKGNIKRGEVNCRRW